MPQDLESSPGEAAGCCPCSSSPPTLTVLPETQLGLDSFLAILAGCRGAAHTATARFELILRITDRKRAGFVCT